jgi:hypothetical protein
MRRAQRERIARVRNAMLDELPFSWLEEEGEIKMSFPCSLWPECGCWFWCGACSALKDKPNG